MFSMLKALLGCALLVFSAACGKRNAYDLPTDKLLSGPGPTFQITDRDLGPAPVVIAYGDMRFTSLSNHMVADPRVRRYLVQQVAAEHPAAVLLNGDIPFEGGNQRDYAAYRDETARWREARLRVFPALGNHEFRGPDAERDLENWWNAFPQLRNRRWYSVQLGSRLYAIALDSDTSLLPGSRQATWFSDQLKDLPSSIDFVIVILHHPPVADVQLGFESTHNPRPNEIALRDQLSELQQQIHARIIVAAGHVHNYERHNFKGVVYLVSGGGGAAPHRIDRTSDDLYQSTLFPNFNYVRFTLRRNALEGTMYRVADPGASNLSVQPMDHFEVAANPRSQVATSR
jgi:hypothetical protein